MGSQAGRVEGGSLHPVAVGVCDTEKGDVGKPGREFGAEALLPLHHIEQLRCPINDEHRPAATD